MIMACGTGKTFTSLKIAEALAGKGGSVLFLVPSLNLLSQSLTEWTQEAAIPLHCFAVCSDSDVGKKRDKDDEAIQTFVHELRYPATTDAKKLAEAVAHGNLNLRFVARLHRPRRHDRGIVVRRHLGIGAVDRRLVKARLGDAGAQIVGDDHSLYTAEKRERARVRSDLRFRHHSNRCRTMGPSLDYD